MSEDKIDWGGQEKVIPQSDEVLEKAVADSVIEMQQNEEKLNKEFKEFQALEKQPNHNNDLLKEVLLLRSGNLSLKESVIEVKENLIVVRNDVLTKKQEKIDMLASIDESLKFIKKHMKKWFWTVLILFGLFNFVLGGLANEHKSTVYPILGSAWNALDNLRQIKNTKSVVEGN